MRRTRFMSLLFLALALAFFCVPEFRQSFHVPMFSLGESEWLMRAGSVDPGRLETWAREAEQQRDAPTLAFVALRHPAEQERARLADAAVALDSSLTWIYWNPPQRPLDPKLVEEQIARLKAWDPDNAIPYLYEAEQIFARQIQSRLRGGNESEVLGKESAWRELMAKAFAAPRYDPYTTRRFEVERALFRRHGLDKPVFVLASLAAYPLPYWYNLRAYGKLFVLKLGEEAERAGRQPEALGHYWTVAHFGERLNLQGRSLIEKLQGEYLQSEAYPRIVPLLRRMGRTDEAASVEYALQQLQQQKAIRSGKEPLAQSTNFYWAALLVHVFLGLVVVFGLLTALCIGYVNAKRWVRPEKKGRLFGFFLAAENYACVLLFLSCLSLYVSYYPYARNFRHYMSAIGESHHFEPFFYNVLPSYTLVWNPTDLLIENPFRSYAWYALGAVVLACLFALVTRPRAPAPPPTAGV